MGPGDPSCLQIYPRWSLDAPRVLLDPFKRNEKTVENHKNEKWNPENLENCEDVHRQIIVVGLAEIRSTQDIHGYL